jgi:phosphoribosylformylglycinamidine synthase I
VTGRPTIAVVVFPGSNDDRDAALALEALGAHAVLVPHAETRLPEVSAVILPGGFSYGDYLRCGAIARLAPVMDAVILFAESGGLVLGICNGFQVLCESGLLPGVLRPNESLSFICRDVPVTVERTDTPFTARAADGERLVIPVKHGEGCWFAPPELVAELEARRQIVLRYAEACNGSVADVAGVVNEAGERAAQALEVAHAQGHGPAPRASAGRVGEANKPLALRSFEQLHDRGETLFPGALRECQLVDELRRSPGCRRLVRHGEHATPVGVTRG